MIADLYLLLLNDFRADMPEADVEKRKRAHQEKRKKLQNPLFFVSATRLCVRNLKKSVTEEQFRDLCIKATKAGLANGLVTPTDIDMQLCSQGLSIREVSARCIEILLVPTRWLKLHIIATCRGFNCAQFQFEVHRWQEGHLVEKYEIKNHERHNTREGSW